MAMIDERPEPHFRDRSRRVVFALESGLLFVPYGFLLVYVLANPFGDLLAMVLPGAYLHAPSGARPFAYAVVSALAYGLFIALVYFFASAGLGVRTFKGFFTELLLWSVILLSPLWLFRSLALFKSGEHTIELEVFFAMLDDPLLAALGFLILFILLFGIIMTSLLRGRLARAALLYFILWFALAVRVAI
jgi:hypothetical protein